MKTHPLGDPANVDVIRAFEGWQEKVAGQFVLYENQNKSGAFSYNEKFIQPLRGMSENGFGHHCAPHALPDSLVDSQKDEIGCSYCEFCETLVAHFDPNGCITLDNEPVQVCVRCRHNAFLSLLQACEEQESRIKLLFEQIRFLVPLVVLSYSTNTDSVIAEKSCSCCGFYATTRISAFTHAEKIGAYEDNRRLPEENLFLCIECLGASTELYLLGGSVPDDLLKLSAKS